jgi:O-phospho-L-seryl-tRNASec:L-selenocysteinyl-tRNA synthase
MHTTYPFSLARAALLLSAAQMNADTTALLAQLVPRSYVEQGMQSLRSREKMLRTLLAQRRLPETGFDDSTIDWLLNTLALMDSNNFPGRAGCGEREARIACPLVARRHWGLGHGIGRSGDVGAVQPKAAGSSVCAQLTHALMLDAIKLSGVRSTKACVVLPVATGMSLVLVLMSLRKRRPSAARYVVWSRIDQKSCFKAMCSAGFTPVVIELVQEGDELRTDVDAIERAVRELGADSVLCVVTTSSCFAPRGIDRLPDVARLCCDLGVAHVVNNAYGLQSKRVCNVLNEACVQSRAAGGDLIFIQSTDKNFCVPVGGSIVAATSKAAISAVCQSYPGRASIAPLLDVFITLLHWGRAGYAEALRKREALAPYLHAQLSAVAAAAGERVLNTPHNPISLAFTLANQLGGGGEAAGDAAAPPPAALDDLGALTEIGAMLFKRNISGTRVVVPGVAKIVEGFEFAHYGSHTNAPMVPYLTAACNIGMTKEEVDSFVAVLGKVLVKFRKRHAVE